MDHSYRTVIVFNDGTSLTARWVTARSARDYITAKLNGYYHRVGVLYHHGTLIDVCHVKPSFYSEASS